MRQVVWSKISFSQPGPLKDSPGGVQLLSLSFPQSYLKNKKQKNTPILSTADTVIFCTFIILSHFFFLEIGKVCTDKKKKKNPIFWASHWSDGGTLPAHLNGGSKALSFCCRWDRKTTTQRKSDNCVSRKKKKARNTKTCVWYSCSGAYNNLISDCFF